MRVIAKIGLWYVLLSGSTLAGAASPTNQGLALTECQLQGTSSSRAVSARCGWQPVLENRANPNGKTIRIRVAVVPALRKQPLPDPIFVLSGGPGQSATDFYLSSAPVFEYLRRERDIVVIDQRGTGESNRLQCAMPSELDEENFDLDAIKSAARKCLGTLAGDPRFYGTSDAVRDLDEIRAALGYERINLYGISYGTRVAQHYLKRHGQHVRAIILDGIVPIQLALGPEVAPAAQRSLTNILQRCLAQEKCHAAFPHVVQDLEQLRERLTSGPIALTINDPSTGSPRSMKFNSLHLAAALRLHSYSDDTASLLPYLIHEAAQGRPAILAAQALLLEKNLNDQIANGMHNAVVCSEDVPFFTDAALKDPNIDSSYLGRVFVDALQATCSFWPKGAIDEGFHEALKSDVPALLLSGENDPVTPSEYGLQVAKSFSHGHHFIVPGQGHGQLNNTCIARLMTRFVEQPTNGKIDSACVAKQAAAPFMLNATSPGP